MPLNNAPQNLDHEEDINTVTMSHIKYSLILSYQCETKTGLKAGFYGAVICGILAELRSDTYSNLRGATL